MTKDRINGIALEKMTSENPSLPGVIQFSIGFPTDDKIQKIIESYQNDSHDFIGAFLENALIAVLGIKREPQKIVIRHISVLPEWRMQSIGALLVTYVKKLFCTLQITCETDEESVGFYQKMDFMCHAFQGKHGNTRYQCVFIQKKT